jgi:hypothetical protein
MIISDEQVRLACEYLQHTNSGTESGERHAHAAESPEFLEKVKLSLSRMPETRHERVEEARSLMASDAPSSDVIAQKMIGRIISDSIR